MDKRGKTGLEADLEDQYLRFLRHFMKRTTENSRS